MIFTRGSFLQILSVALFMLTASARASSTAPLLTATSDAFNGVHTISVVLSSDHVVTAVDYSDGKQSKAYPIANLSKGIVLLSSSGADVITLKSSVFNPTSGGEIQLIYLVNGISGKTRQVLISIERTGDHWDLLANDQSGRRIVTKSYFKANKVLGQIVGIDSVSFKN